MVVPCCVPYNLFIVGNGFPYCSELSKVGTATLEILFKTSSLSCLLSCWGWGLLLILVAAALLGYCVRSTVINSMYRRTWFLS